MTNYLSHVKSFISLGAVKKPSIGLDIGSQSCKAIELLPTKDSFEVVNSTLEPVIKGNYSDALKKVLAKLDVGSKNLSTAISGHGTLIRYVDMPKMSLADARQSFILEADKYFPFAKEQIYMDCFIVDSHIAENKMSLLVAAGKKELVDQRMKLLTDLGLEANFIGVNAIAIANAFNKLRLPSAKKEENLEKVGSDTVALLDIGDATANLVILKNNVPCFTRDIFIGGRELSKSISNIFGVSGEEAEKLKCTPSEKKDAMFNACESTLSNLSSEIRLSFDYFATEHNTFVSELFLTGGSSMLAGVENFFTKSLDVPTQQWNPIETLVINPQVDKSELNQKAGCFTVALGLALYQ